MRDAARAFRALHVDIGTGDGAFVRAAAAARADELFIGIDAAAEGLREVSRRVAAKPARGGLANALFGRLALDDAPGELTGLADHLTVLLPWGSLLRAVARPDPERLARLRAIGRPGATVRIVYGYDAQADAAAIRALDLPALGDGDDTVAALPPAYRAAGLMVTARLASIDEVRGLPTTWAKRLAFSGRARRFVAIEGRVL